MIAIYSYISSNDSSIFSYIPDLPSCKRFHIFWLVVLTPLKNMTSSVGMMTFPTEWKVIQNSMVPVTTNQLPHGDGSKPYPPVVHIKIAGKWMVIPLKMVFS